MIQFISEVEFSVPKDLETKTWIEKSIVNEGFEEGEINFIFCSDEALLEKNIKYLNHDTLTDIISFDYTLGKLVSGDIFISIDRVIDNSKQFESDFNDELNRVMIHGILHYCGYKDKEDEDKKVMREKEDYYLSLRTF